MQDFHFKEMRKIRVFDSPSELPTGRTSLLATSSKYGVTFVGCPTGKAATSASLVQKCSNILARPKFMVRMVGQL